MKESERIFNSNAKKKMLKWDYVAFKKDFPTLHSVIIDSIEESSINNIKVVNPETIPYYCSCNQAKGLDHDEDGSAYCVDCQKYIKP